MEAAVNEDTLYPGMWVLGKERGVGRRENNSYS